MSVTKPYTLGLICARGGSKGVPRKNVRVLGGRPLIAWSIDAAQQCPELDRLIVSTDDAEIAEVARACGAEVPFMRPAEFASDTASEWLVWRHAIQAMTDELGFRPEVLVNIPPTSPLRLPADISACWRQLCGTDADVVITVREAARNPYYNMVFLDEAGLARLVIPPTVEMHQRQGAPAVFDITTVAYAARTSHVLARDSIFAGKVRAVSVPVERSLDIDTEYDWLVAEALIRARQGGRT